MLTQTHALVGLALFAHRSRPKLTAAALLGSVVPDLDVWLMFIIERAHGTPGCEIFHFRYLERPWTDLQAILNSIPLGLTLLLFALAIRGRDKIGTKEVPAPGRPDVDNARNGSVILAFAVAALLHLVSDLALHHEDARRQLWPLSNYVFRSPVSYWDPDHFGTVFMPFEIGLGILLSLLLINRLPKPLLGFLILTASIGYAAMVYASFFGAAVHERGPGSCDRPDALARVSRAAVGWSA